MSKPAKGTIFSKVKFEEKEYSSFSNPLGDEIQRKIQVYKKRKNLPWTSAPWAYNKYGWIIEDGKLFLNYIYLMDDDQDNCIKDIVGDDKIFASWVNKEIELRVSKEYLKQIESDFTDLEIEAINTQGPSVVQIELMVLYFNDGQLTHIEEKLTERYIERRLRDYVER